MNKPKTRWIVIFIVLAALQLFVLFNSENPESATVDTIDKADTAWMIVPLRFVLFMTRGFPFFYGGMVSVKNDFHHAPEFHCPGCYQPAVVSGWFQPSL